MQLFNERESTCVDNCAYKVFATDKVMRAYLPTRFAELKLNQKELENRLNNPNEEHGPYFYKLSYEDAQEQKWPYMHYFLSLIRITWSIN